MVGGLNRVFAERDKKQTKIGLRGNLDKLANWFKNLLCPTIRLSRLWSLKKAEEQNIGQRGGVL
jgi:hypothetical protein